MATPARASHCIICVSSTTAALEKRGDDIALRCTNSLIDCEMRKTISCRVGTVSGSPEVPGESKVRLLSLCGGPGAPKNGNLSRVLRSGPTRNPSHRCVFVEIFDSQKRSHSIACSVSQSASVVILTTTVFRAIRACGTY